MINRDSFEQWEEVTNPSPMAARQMYMLLLSAKDEVADDVLKLAAKRRLSAKMLLPYLKSKDLDSSKLEAAIEAESGGAEAPLPKPRTQTSSFFDRHPAGGQQAVPTRTFTPVEEPKRAQKEPSFLEKMKAKLAKQKDDQARSDSNGGDGNSKKKVILWIISIVAVLILLGALGFWLFQTSGSQSPFSSGASYSSQQTEAPTQTLPQSTETPPQLTNPNPLDFVSNTWLKALQLLLTVEIIGIIVVLFGDAKVRKQLLDAVVTMLMTVLTVFVVLPADTAWWIAGLLLLFEVGVVLYASISGGRDFTPTGAYFLCVGTIGGLLANKIEAFQAVFHITSA